MCVRRSGPLKNASRMLLSTSSRHLFIAITIPSLLLTTTLVHSFIIPNNNDNNPLTTAIRKKSTTTTKPPSPPPLPPSAKTTTLSLSSNNNNPLSSLMTGLKSSLFSSSSSSSTSLTTKNPTLDSQLTSTISYTWPSLRSTLHTLQTPLERSFRSSLPHGYGPASPLHTLRLYSPSSQETPPRVTLYRDSASWCPYCQKVWIALEEKRIPYKIEKINMRCYGDKPRSFTKLQPSGNIPVAVIDGVVYNQSNDIMMALERLFPENKSLSDYDGEEERARMLLRLERRLFGAWMYWLTGSGEGMKREFISVLNEVEAELRNNNNKKGFFVGDDVTIVDLMYAPFLERMAASLLYFKGFRIRVPKGMEETTTTEGYPYVNRWFDAMETLESYRLTKSDYYTHCWDLPPQLGGCVEEAEGEKYRRAINGGVLPDGGKGVASWELPLVKDNGGIEPDWGWCGDEDEAKREAVERVSFNYENIAKFASRGAVGTNTGFPPVMAPLSDPNALPTEGVQMAVDVILRIICMAMLKGLDEVEADMTNVARVVKEEGGEAFAEGVVKSLAYLRDRVGVPRDMRLPAARYLRAHINWALKYIID